MDKADWGLLAMLFGLMVLGCLGFALVAIAIYWTWVGVAYLVGGVLGALVGAFVHGYHLFVT